MELVIVYIIAYGMHRNISKPLVEERFGIYMTNATTIFRNVQHDFVRHMTYCVVNGFETLLGSSTAL